MNKGNRKWHWVFWGVYFLVMFFTFSKNITDLNSLLISVTYLAGNVCAAYITLDWWLPRFYQKRQYDFFLLATGATILLFTFLINVAIYVFLLYFGKEVIDLHTFNKKIFAAAFTSNVIGISFLTIPAYFLQTEIAKRKVQLKKGKFRKWHWLFWVVYFMVNHLLFSPEFWSIYSWSIQLIFLVHNAGTAYIVLDKWIPKFYLKKRYVLFVLATIATILLFTILLNATLYAFFSHWGKGLIDLTTFSVQFLAPTCMSNISGIAFLAIPYFISQRIEMERKNQQLEKEKLEAELKFLKSQLHPHFLFNALNNIYFLIKKDPDTAAEALAGFSNLLRFQLYDANNPRVSLDKEIEYLQQFADIAQLRKGENFKVNWDITTNTENVQIAPLLLMPLIENAFKHGSNKNGKIDIQLKVDNQHQLKFRIANSKEANKSQGVAGFEEGGIGLTNIQKRLKLLYPNRHNFTITDTVAEFIVDLNVDLEVIATEQKEAIVQQTANPTINPQTTI